jgi:biopolymer transport protein ExbD
MAGGIQSDDEIMSGINVTPMVDVTLVLVIIMIVTAKNIVSQSLPMDLPKASTGSEQQTIFSVELASNGQTAVNSQRLTSDDQILPLAREARSKNPELRAVIKADTAVQHGRVIQVMDLLKQAGVVKVAFGVSPGGTTPRAPKPAGSP